MKKDGVKANFIYNLIYNIVNIIVPLVTAPYTARVLGAENIGIYSYTYAIVSSVVMFGALGTATYGQKEIGNMGFESCYDGDRLFDFCAVCIPNNSLDILRIANSIYSSRRF